jgi:protein transport protein SEC23
MTRLAVHKTLTEYTFDILRWVDRMLIRLVSKFASFTKDDPASFRLCAEFAYYPQFMFHLRRSQFLQIFNSSPDETAFFRVVLNQENIMNSVVMIQPTLMAYSLDGPAQAVMLDVGSCAPNRILVLDTFFHIVIWYGDTIAKWRADGIHLKPEYEYFNELLKAPKADAENTMKDRYPFPRFIECIEGGSQSRFLMAKLNPSITQNTMGDVAGAAPPVFTDDVSLKVFMEHLRRLSVTS